MHFLEISYCSCGGRLSGFSPSPVVRNTNRIRTFWRFCIAPAKASWTDLADFPESGTKTEGTDISVRNMGGGAECIFGQG